jgi:hypothetical protein
MYALHPPKGALFAFVEGYMIARNVGPDSLIVPIPGRQTRTTIEWKGNTSNRRMSIPPVVRRGKLGRTSFPQAPTFKERSEYPSLFERLEAGAESLHHQFSTGFRVDSLKGGPGLLGKQVQLQMQVRFPTLRAEFRLELERKWASEGKLWSGVAKPKPILMDLPAEPDIYECGGGIDSPPNFTPVQR